MSQSGDKIEISEYRDICRKEYEKDRENYDTEVQGMTEYMRDVKMLSDNKNLLYKNKQKYIRRKFEVADKIVFLNKNLTALRKQKLNNYKFGNVRSETGNAIKPANDFERKLFLEADLSSFEETKQILDNHISFIEDTIKNISDMVFGIPYVLQLEEFKRMLK